MLRISKILTLNKVHILEKLCAHPSSSSDPVIDYFHLGAPILDPPYIRGSMILQLDLQFLYDNCEFFEYGSPIDTGAIRFGFLNPPDRESFLVDVTCGVEKFLRLIKDLQALPSAVLDHVVQHRATPAARDALLNHFEPRVIDFMLANDEPNAWMFEFGLRRGYRMQAAHIATLLYPNTYSAVPVFSKVRGIIGTRARQFNPRRGIECQ